MMKQRSIKTKVTFVLMEMLIPLIVFLICYNFYVINMLNQEISESNQNTLKSYCSNMEETLQNLQNSMTSFISLDTNYKLLTKKNSDLDAHTRSLEILQTYDGLLDMNPFLCGCVIISYSNDLYREIYRESFTGLEEKEKILEHLKSETASHGELLDKIWRPFTFGKRHFLYLLMGYNGTYAVYLIDLDSVNLPQKNDSKEKNGEMIFYQKNKILTNCEEIKENKINIKESKIKLKESKIKIKSKKDYYFSGNPRKYMIIEQPLKYTTVRAIYLVEYRGILGELSHLQFFIFFISLLSVFIIPFGYQKLKVVFFKPVDTLVKTMEEIKKGKLEARVTTTYTDTEFLEVNNTFNSMIEQINQLKIDSYEKELNLKKIQLQFYQIQIKPHFYMNCLKNMYGMMEEEKYEDMKKAIIYLSNHLRYILRNSSMVVPVVEELKYIRNYIALQQLSLAYPPECKLEVDSSLNNFMIPPISILSFVENSVKYAMHLEKNLFIHIRIRFIQSEDTNYINITISDNGGGFTEEQIRQLNHYLEDSAGEQSIGINNVIKRYLLFYGEEKVWFAFSNRDGAHIDIFIKVGTEDLNEHSHS